MIVDEASLHTGFRLAVCVMKADTTDATLAVHPLATHLASYAVWNLRFRLHMRSVFRQITPKPRFKTI